MVHVLWRGSHVVSHVLKCGAHKWWPRGAAYAPEPNQFTVGLNCWFVNPSDDSLKSCLFRLINLMSGFWETRIWRIRSSTGENNWNRIEWNDNQHLNSPATRRVAVRAVRGIFELVRAATTFSSAPIVAFWLCGNAVKCLLRTWCLSHLSIIWLAGNRFHLREKP